MLECQEPKTIFHHHFPESFHFTSFDTPFDPPSDPPGAPHSTATSGAGALCLAPPRPGAAADGGCGAQPGGEDASAARRRVDGLLSLKRRTDATDAN